MSRRQLIRMSDEERRKFIGEAQTVILCSLSKDGFPHPMPMWFAVEDDDAIVMTTFSKSQKVRNLERDPRVSLLIEDGEEYAKLRGVVLEGRAELDPRTETVLSVLERITARRGAAPGADPAAVRGALKLTAPKRVAIRLRPERVVSWDHTKLGGIY